MVLFPFWIGFASEAIAIYQSPNIDLSVIKQPYLYKDIWHLILKQMNSIFLPKPI